THSTTPIQVPEIPPVVQLSVGWNAACGVTADGNLVCWGANNNGELGKGVPSVYEAPFEPEIEHVVSVAMGANHTCALFDSGDVRCWGNNQFGQMGMPPVNAFEVMPQEVAEAAGAVAIEAGFAHNCAVLPSRDVVCWGSNSFGEIGDGALGNVGAPHPLSLPNG